MRLDRRTLPGETEAQVLVELDRYLEHAAASGCGATLAARSSRSPTSGPAAFCTNGSATAALAIPTVIFGPGDPTLAHQADEYVELASLTEATEGFAKLASAAAS